MRLESAAAIETQRREWRAVSDDPNRERLAKEVALAVMALSLHDPESLEVVSWGELQTNGEGYRMDMSYRARNRLGAMSLESRQFHYDSDMRPTTTTDLN